MVQASDTRQGAEFRAQSWALRVLLAASALLTAALWPAQRTQAELLAAAPPRVTMAFDVMASVPQASELLPVLDQHGVTIQFARMAPGLYARYSVARRAIEIDERWGDADAGTLAAVIAHEATHAQDAVNGYLASGGASACIDSEIRAFRVSAEVWTSLHGPTGKASATDELERQLNLIADRYQRDPAQLEMLVRQAYTDQCAQAEATKPAT